MSWTPECQRIAALADMMVAKKILTLTSKTGEGEVTIALAPRALLPELKTPVIPQLDPDKLRTGAAPVAEMVDGEAIDPTLEFAHTDSPTEE